MQHKTCCRWPAEGGARVQGAGGREGLLGPVHLWRVAHHRGEHARHEVRRFHSHRWGLHQLISAPNVPVFTGKGQGSICFFLNNHLGSKNVDYCAPNVHCCVFLCTGYWFWRISRSAEYPGYFLTYAVGNYFWQKIYIFTNSLFVLKNKEQETLQISFFHFKKVSGLCLQIPSSIFGRISGRRPISVLPYPVSGRILDIKSQIIRPTGNQGEYGIG